MRGERGVGGGGTKVRRGKRVRGDVDGGVRGDGGGEE